MSHRAWPAPLAAALTLTLGTALAQSRSAMTGITLPANSRASANAAQLRQAAAQLNSVARANKISGQCKRTEAFTLQLDDDDAIDDLETGFRKAGYAVKELPSDSDDELAFTLRKGQQTLVATIAFGDTTVLTWCAYGPANASTVPATRSATPSAPTASRTAARPAPKPITPPVRAPAALQPTARPPAVTAGLGGLYFRLRIFGNTTIEEYFYFLPDGQVTLVLPQGGLDPLDQRWLAELRKRHPENMASYRLEGGDIVFSIPGKPPRRESFARDADGNLSIGGLFTKRVARFANGQRMSARYSYAGGASGGGTSVSAGSTLILRADGSFSASGVAGASMSAGGQTETARSSSQSSGRYQLSGNTLVLSHVDGRTTRHTVFPYFLKGDPGDYPRWFYLDGAQMKLMR
ncbi:hypothetical protein [Deinococcus navajonensis]|uniref:Uncharacterized protein n=1 Tax=Deinococcus navajonensis TaxID=309884 RepID=A0ABV8XKN7_9DEIO